MAAKYYITTDAHVVRGDDKSFQFTFTEDSTPIDISGWDIWMTVKSNPMDDDEDAIIAIDPTDVSKIDSGDGVVDTAIISISSTQNTINPATYFFDIQAKDDSGKITTLQKAKYVVETDITQRTS